MKQVALFVICMVFAPALAQPAQPFGLKADVLGETIQDFSRQNHAVCSTDKVGALDVLPIEVDISGATEGEQRAGVVKCIATGDATVGGVAAYRTVFYFFRDRLYKIESELPRTEYAHIREALTAKYGSPAPARRIGYQNGFGAQFVGERLSWHNQASSIAIGELDSESDNVRLVFQHKALASECERAGSMKNRAGDL
jgi:hypothetical protein